MAISNPVGPAPITALRGFARSRRGRAPLALALCGGLVALAVNVPLAYIFIRALQGGWRAYFSSVLSASTAMLLVQTLALVVGVVTLALGIALSMAWLVARTDLWGRRLWALLGALPLVFPSYVSAFAIVAAFGPRGFVQGWLEPLGVERLPGLAYGFSGALVSLALFTYPYIYLLLVPALRSVDGAMEDSSRSLGHGRWSTFFRVVLPQLRTPLFAGSLLVALYAISDFGAVSIVRYNTLTLSVYNAYRTLFDRSVAASMATVLVVVALGLIVVQALLLRRVRASPTTVRPARRPVALGRWQWPCQAGLAAIVLFTLGTCTGVVVFWGLRSSVLPAALARVADATRNSVAVSLLAAVAAVLLALPLATWSVRYPGRLSRSAERIGYSGFALPGLVIALSIVFVATRHFPALYQTTALLIAAYVVRFLPESLSATRSALAGVAPELEEAARSLGRPPLNVLRTVTLPLIRPGLLAGAGLVFLTSMKELPATLILHPAGFDTLATRVWSAASEGVYSEASLPALLLLLASAGPVYLLTIRPALSREE